MRTIILIIVLLASTFCFGQQRSVGYDLGITSKKHVPITAYFIYNKYYIGFSYATSVNNGTSGEDYSGTIQWNEYPDHFVKQGIYYNAFTIDQAYNIYDNLYFGLGIGYGIKYRYLNCFDDNEIYGDKGRYYLRDKAGKRLEMKIFGCYFFTTNDQWNFFTKIQYSFHTGFGISLGIDINS